MKNDTLKKHHFWFLLIPFAICALIVVVVLWNSIGATIAAKEKENADAVTTVQGKNPKTKGTIALLEVYNKTAEQTRGDKWQENWALQIGVRENAVEDATNKAGKRWAMQQVDSNLFQWPSSPLLNSYNYIPDGYIIPPEPTDEKPDYNAWFRSWKPKFKGLAFGEKIPNTRSQLLAFKDPAVYLAEYSTANSLDKPGTGTGMADRMWPTQFNGGWQSVLRHVDGTEGGQGWGTGMPSDAEIWLALEDLWVQRSLLDSLRGVNERLAGFEPTNTAPDGRSPLKADHKAFRSRTWHLDIWVETRESDGQKVLLGTLTNITGRVQTFGLNGQLIFQVWAEQSNSPMELVFNERYLTGLGGHKTALRTVKGPDGKETTQESQVPGDSVTITAERGAELRKAGIGSGTVSINRVRQVFDVRTVPVQRIDRLVLGYPDSRNAGIAPKPPRTTLPAFPEVAAPVDPNSGTMPGTGTMPGSGTPMGAIPPRISLGGGEGPGSVGGGGGAGGMSGTVGAGWTVLTGRVPSKSLLDMTRNRYLGEPTGQVRRLPVGLVLIVDQTNLQDVLLALANSRLRFQITQVHWSRFRGTIAGTEPGSYGSGGSTMPGSGSSGGPLIIGGSGFGGGPEMGGMRPPGGRPVGPGPGSPGPGSPAPRPGGLFPAPGGTGFPLAGGSGQPGGESGFGGGAGGDGNIQLTSGLVEVSVYGIVSLYEKYTSPAETQQAEAEKTATP